MKFYLTMYPQVILSYSFLVVSNSSEVASLTQLGRVFVLCSVTVSYFTICFLGSRYMKSWTATKKRVYPFLPPRFLPLLTVFLFKYRETIPRLVSLQVPYSHFYLYFIPIKFKYSMLHSPEL